ncbi:MAG: glycosyltransferase [Gammaproteobacteria bacterium]
MQPNAHFLIVGEGSEREMLENICRESGLKEVVHFLGNRKDIPRLLKASDIGVLTSHSEGLSNALIEYLAAGLPVVCTNVGGNAEIVVDGHNGYVVPARDGAAIAEALCRLLSNLKLAKEMGENSAKRVAELFDIERCVERTTALYERLLGEKENAAATAPIANK